MSKTAVVIGVGPEKGVGAYVCQRAASEGLHVFVAGRTAAKLEKVVTAIVDNGGTATAVPTDTTVESEVTALIAQAEETGPIDLAVFNAGNSYRGDFLEMEAAYFEECWRVGCFGGFLFSRECLRRMSPRGSGTLLFTGASASMRGKPNFAAFTSSKAGLRTLAQSLAREFAPKGIHVAHVIIDGGVYGERNITRNPEFAAIEGEEGLIGLDGIADAYQFLYRQPRNAWTHELDLRTHKENF